MHALKKGQAVLWQGDDPVMGPVRLIQRNFGIYAI
jgi:hypothetical protein